MKIANKQKIEALERARRHIAFESEYFICLALERVSKLNLNLADACFELRDYIERQLGRHVTLDEWMVANNIATKSEIYNDPSKIRYTRLAWIDWMIYQLEIK